MEVVLIIGGLFIVWELLQRQQATMATAAATVPGTTAAASNPVAVQQLQKVITQNVAATQSTLALSLASNTGGISGGQIAGVAASGAEAGIGIAASVGALSGTVAAVTAGIGVALTPVFVLLAQHTQRAKDAKNENAFINAIVPAFDADLAAINQAYNSGQIDGPTAIAALNEVHDNFWQGALKVQGQPGIADNSGNGTRCAPCTNASDPANTPAGQYHGAQTCNSSCTASCCVGCDDINCSIQNATNAINAGGGTSFVNRVFPSKYGAANRPGYNLTWRHP